MKRLHTLTFALCILSILIEFSTGRQLMSAEPEMNIWQAAATGNLDAITIQLANGQDIDAKSPSIGLTPLMAAAITGHTDAATLLLAQGANPDVQSESDGTTALHLAAFFGHIKIVRPILELGGDVNVRNNQAETPLDTVKDEWNPELERLYRTLAKVLKLELDLQRIQAARPEIARLLAQAGGQSGQTAAPTAADFQPPDDVIFRSAWIISEGTRMAAEVFTPKESTGQLPTILMSHGWGGTARHLREDAITFARAGFLVVTFDYRGWGNSDARIVAMSRPRQSNGKLLAEVREVRGVVDPIDQTTDMLNALHWVRGEPQCDSDRIGIWGSSFSGGHVVYVAARDPRVKALVSQVGSMDARWVIQSPEFRKLTFRQGTQRTRGEIGYPEPFGAFGGLTGKPVWEKLMRYAPIEDVDRCQSCAKLFIIAENEELFDNQDHAIAAYERATGVKKLVTLKGITHYGVYREKRNEAQQLAIDWFREHL